ncbi:TPA: hypothetical protein HA278_00135 [Candidatus Woesearchaeota archaeon]|nr:hypothetical protein [archaeon]HIJ10437.1 hypothetical protein [Candidatus Woesearchaeota archaeon]
MALADGPEIPDGIDPADQEQFDAILQPVMKIYSFVKYISTIVAAIFLLYAGITYMSSGSDPRKRDQAKNTATYVFVGLFVIWAAPLLIGLMA